MACTFKTSDAIFHWAQDARIDLPPADVYYRLERWIELGDYATAVHEMYDLARRYRIVAQIYLDHFNRINNPDDLSFHIPAGVDWTPGIDENITRHSYISDDGPAPGTMEAPDLYANMPDCVDIFGGEGKIDDDILTSDDRTSMRIWLGINIDKYNEVAGEIEAADYADAEARSMPPYHGWTDSEWRAIWSRLVVIWDGIKHFGYVPQVRDFLACQRSFPEDHRGVVATDCSSAYYTWEEDAEPVMGVETGLGPTDGDFEPDAGAEITEIADDITDDPPEFGIPEEEYEELLAAGKVLTSCDPPESVFEPAECPPCIRNPDAIVPDWRFKEEGDVFINKRTCEYCVTVNSGETDVEVLNDTSPGGTQEIFLEEQRVRGVDLILEFFGKSNLTEDARTLILDDSVIKEYDVPFRPLMPIRSLVCVSVASIDSLQPTEAEETEAPIGPIGCVLEAPKVRAMIRRANEAFRYYGHKMAVWSRTTGYTLSPDFDPKEERKKLREFIPILVQLMGRNGFKLNGKNAAEKIEFRFNKNYEVIYAQANEPGCEPVELLWEQDGDNLGGFKAQEPINDARTMAYISALVDLVDDAGARDPKGWDEFFSKYTYPPLDTTIVTDPLGDRAMADGPLQQAAQAIVDEIVSLPDAIVSKFSNQICRDRAGKPIFDADINDFDEMLRRAIYSKGRALKIGDNIWINLPELLSESGNIHDLYENIINKLGICGFLDLLSAAFACLTAGIDLGDAIGIIVRAALKAMDPGNLEKLFIGLPPDKQMEVKRKIADAGWGSIPAPWEAGYRPGAYNYNVELDKNGDPVPQEYNRPNPDYKWNEPRDETNQPHITVPRGEDVRNVAERTAQYRMEAQGTIPLGVSGTSAQFGGGGSVGTAAANTIDAILDAYVEAILDSVDAQFLLEQLGKFPGAELVAKILLNKDCPPPPLFNPPLNEFMKTLELDFCRGITNPPVLPKIRKFKIPDFFRMLMEALLAVLLELAVQIIMIILELILKLLLNGLCNLVKLLGSLVTGLFENQPSNSFADSIKDSLSDTGLGDLGQSLPLADDAAINQAAADLFSAFGRSCTEPDDLPDGDDTEAFLRDIGLVLTQGEFIELVAGTSTNEVVSAVYQLVSIRHQKFLCVFPNLSAVEAFFRSLGSMIDPLFLQEAITPDNAGLPVFPSTCSDTQGVDEINSLRRQLLLGKGLNPDLVDEQIDSLKCRALQDLESLADIAQNGVFANVPPIMDDYSDPSCPVPGLMPRDPSAEMLPNGPMDMLAGPVSIFGNMFDILEKMYYRDMVGRGGFINMVLSDKEGRGLRAHNSFVAFQSIFGLFPGRANTHQILLPETIGAYLLNALKNPEEEMNDKADIHQVLRQGMPVIKMEYCNYYNKKNRDFYEFEITGAPFKKKGVTRLNNKYNLTLTEKFNYDFEPFEGDDEDDNAPDDNKTEIETEFSGDPGFPPGVQELIEEELGLDIEGVLAESRADGMEISSQAAVFGAYIEKVLRDNINPVYSDRANANQKLKDIRIACQTDMHEYITNQFFNFLVATLGDDSPAFLYGQGGSSFDKNNPLEYPPKPIFLDETHTHPVTGEPQDLDPFAWGGNEKFPAVYIQPPQNRPGWCGIADKLIPEVDACEPARKNIVRYDDVIDKMVDFYGQIADDDRSGGASCLIEEPCNKILSRAATAMIEGNIRATIRIYAAEAFLKGMPAFIKFKADTSELYGHPLTAYITESLKAGFYRYSKKGFGRRKNDEYFYQILEQAVQNFGKKIDAGLVEPTTEEQEALDIINSLQTIWMKDTKPSSGKEYAGTGERLKRVLSPGLVGASISNVFRGSGNKIPINKEDGPLSKAKAKKLKEESWDLFMREIEPQAEIILRRYIDEEISYIADEFSKRIPPHYRTLHQMFLGNGPFGMYGNALFGKKNGRPYDTPISGDKNPLNVVSDAILPEILASGEFRDYSMIDDASGRTLVAAGPNPFSTVYKFVPAEDEDGEASRSASYWPFALEKYILIEDYDVDYFTLELPLSLAAGTPEEARTAVEEIYGPLDAHGVPMVWKDHVFTRPKHLYGVVRMREWKEYLESKAPEFATSGVKRSDLWPSWSYGLRIMLVPPSTTELVEGNEPKPGKGSVDRMIEIKTHIQNISRDDRDITAHLPFLEETIQNNKAFSFGFSGEVPIEGTGSDPTPDRDFPILPTPTENPLASDLDPMPIPLANGYLPINMDVSASDAAHAWYETYEGGSADGNGFASLIQNLVCSPEYQMLFRYCFNMPRILSIIAVYIIKAFVPSIGRATTGENGAPEIKKDASKLHNANAVAEADDGSDLETQIPEEITTDNDGWYAGSKAIAIANTYHGGGLGVSPFSLSFKRWEHEESFKRSKKLVARSFMDVYNSEDNSYKGETDNSVEKAARNGLNVSWPKFSVRLWSKKVDRPYDKDGNLCFNPDEDYSDSDD